jgi:hypothetical protein
MWLIFFNQLTRLFLKIAKTTLAKSLQPRSKATSSSTDKRFTKEALESSEQITVFNTPMLSQVMEKTLLTLKCPSREIPRLTALKSNRHFHVKNRRVMVAYRSIFSRVFRQQKQNYEGFSVQSYGKPVFSEFNIHFARTLIRPGIADSLFRVFHSFPLQ